LAELTRQQTGVENLADQPAVGLFAEVTVQPEAENLANQENTLSEQDELEVMSNDLDDKVRDSLPFTSEIDSNDDDITQSSEESEDQSKKDKKKGKKERQRIKKQSDKAIENEDEKKRKAIDDMKLERNQKPKNGRTLSPREIDRLALSGGLVSKETDTLGAVQAIPVASPSNSIFQHVNHDLLSPSLTPLKSRPTTTNKITKENRTGI
jgi:hypothetical protein